jgi:hypothetical protein
MQNGRSFNARDLSVTAVYVTIEESVGRVLGVVLAIAI